MAWLRAVAGFQVFRGGRISVFGDTTTMRSFTNRSMR
jgi:ABC-type Fe3+/spermidine/putrescine transport system ATPase subunit